MEGIIKTERVRFMKRSEIPVFGPLQGVKVVSVVNNVAGPILAGFYGEMGAQVTYVENSNAPDTLRLLPPGFYWSLEHRNQLNINLDFSVEEGLEVFKKLLETNDIFVENGKVGNFEKFGLSDEQIHKINPRLIIVHISGFGQTGDPDYIKRGAIDAIGQAFSGYMNMNGMPGDDMPPLAAKYNTCDYTTGLMATISSLAALYRREKTGEGEVIDLAMYEAMLRIGGMPLSLGLNIGREAVRPGNVPMESPGLGTYKCKDGKWVYWVAAYGPILRRTLKLLGLDNDPDIPATYRLDRSNPVVNEKIANAHIKFCEERDALQVEKEVNAVGGLCSAVMTYADMQNHPHYQKRGSFMEWVDPWKNQTVKGLTPPARFKNNPSQIWRGGPTVGMDNDDILLELGYTEQQIAEMYEKKAIKKV